MNTSLALDGDDYPHIDYYVWWSKDLKYAYQDAGGWHPETVDSAGEVGQAVSLALDGADDPHLAYYDADNEALKYAHLDATGWHSTTVAAGIGTYWQGSGRAISLDIDNGGYPHVLYLDMALGAIRYIHLDATGWHTTTVDSDLGTYPGGLSLALASDGYAHASYESGASGQSLKYAFQDAAGWHVLTVGQGYWYTSLAFDSAGQPHISYYDGQNRDLLYASYLNLDHALYLPLVSKPASGVQEEGIMR
jgi:hypothetical protein